MKTSLKKLVAGASILALVLINSTYATQIGTGSITDGSSTAINSDWDGTSTPTGTTASGSLDVQVTAQVVPTLSMTISTGALNFGVLELGANTESLSVVTATNAKDGVIVAVGSTGLATGDTGTDKFIGNLGRVAAVATASSDSYEMRSSTDASGDVIVADTDVAGTQNILVADNVTEANATTTVYLTATIDAQTEAGNYNDTLTFTVTGSF